MRTFTATPVPKDALLERLHQHRDNDSFQRGHFWNPMTATGCSVGCTIHDFAPGEEAQHEEYERLFGIPAELAVLEDSIFEHMGDVPNPTAWPLEFIQSIPPGKDLDQAAGRWIQKLLQHPDSPLSPAHQEPHTLAAHSLITH